MGPISEIVLQGSGMGPEVSPFQQVLDVLTPPKVSTLMKTEHLGAFILVKKASVL